MSKFEPPSARPFHIMAKPTGAICNLNCTYCFYLGKRHLYPNTDEFKMSDDLLEKYTRAYMKQPAEVIIFTWQGGEPTLMGIDFYRKAMELQERFRPPGKTIQNSIQTNGVFVNEEWASFFKENDFLVELSLDGPADFHNAYRRTKGGRGAHQKVMRGITHLEDHEVEYNILCCLNSSNVESLREVYRFLKEESGTPCWQFIPIVEKNPHNERELSPYSITAQQYGEFLTQVFNWWVRRDLGSISIQLFDVRLRRYLGVSAGLCVFEKYCGNALAMEHNGDVFSCDHYVDTDHKLGNVYDTPIQEMLNDPFQRKFGNDKYEALSEYCRSCDIVDLCNGGCPKNRINETPDGEKGLNFLCSGYKKYFTETAPYMRYIADQYRRKTPFPLMMEYIRENPEQFFSSLPDRNERCYCGSGMKYKKCCL